MGRFFARADSGFASPRLPQGFCIRGDLCPYAHGVFECWLHPSRYRTQLCKDGATCHRPVCFFAHSLNELRAPTFTWLPSPADVARPMLPYAAASAAAAGNGTSRTEEGGMTPGLPSAAAAGLAVKADSRSGSSSLGLAAGVTQGSGGAETDAQLQSAGSSALQVRGPGGMRVHEKRASCLRHAAAYLYRMRLCSAQPSH
jgi:hypothetical protein